ncbi:MAG: hypothetical protein RPS47_14440 [Colwellia sp.]|jgi:hypothetical protein
MTLNKYDHVFVVGGTKCGSTALFKYLDAHDQIVGTKVKESRYFLNESYPLEKCVESSFDDFYAEGVSGGIRLDSTPDYLYCDGAPDKIKEYIDSVAGRALIVVVVRKPLERLISFYNYAVQQGIIDNQLTFDRFVIESSREELKVPHPVSLAFSQCNYSKYIAAYIERFGKSDVVVFDSLALKNSPVDVVGDICEKLAIDSEFYKSYAFPEYNKTVVPKNKVLGSLYHKVERYLRVSLAGKGFVFSFFASIKPYIDNLYKIINGAKKDVQLGSEALVVVDALAKAERQRLRDMGVLVKW